jgi:hypothetical protein
MKIEIFDGSEQLKGPLYYRIINYIPSVFILIGSTISQPEFIPTCRIRRYGIQSNGSIEWFTEVSIFIYGVLTFYQKIRMYDQEKAMKIAFDSILSDMIKIGYYHAYHISKKQQHRR